jgi:signal transduction histidine kinase
MNLLHHRWLVDTPLKVSILSSAVCMLLSALIGLVFYRDAILEAMLTSLVIAAPISYITLRVVVRFRQRIEEQNIRLALEQERANILTSFIRDAAHEFKTPLSIMQNSLYLLEKDPARTSDQAQRIRDQIKTLDRLLDAILVMTRLDNHRPDDYPRRSVSIRELVAAIRAADPASQFTVLPVNLDGLPATCINLDDVDLALRQILDNARRFSPVDSRIVIQFSRSDPFLLIQISDAGKGMGTEAVQHIFERFYREDNSHSTRGLGLGLAIASRALELNRGQIEVQSQPGSGTTVQIYLPINAAAPSPAFRLFQEKNTPF